MREEWALHSDDSSDHVPANIRLDLLDISVPDLSYWMGKFILNLLSTTATNSGNFRQTLDAEMKRLLDGT